MDPNPTNYPVLSYVLSRLPSIGPLRQPKSPSFEPDIEQPAIPTRNPNADPTFHDTLISRMPHLTDPKVLSEMSSAVSKIAQTRSVLHSLADRPDHESVDIARSKLVEIASVLDGGLDEVALSPRHGDHVQVREGDGEREKLERERTMYQAIVQVDETHEAYEKVLRAAEEKLMRIYDAAVAAKDGDGGEGDGVVEEEEVNEDVVRVLKEGDSVERVDLSGKKLRILPEAFGRLKRVVVLNLSSNQLQITLNRTHELEISWQWPNRE